MSQGAKGTAQLSAGVILIGDELLSGRTRDINLQQIAEFLSPYGIPVLEARVIGDEAQLISDTVQDFSNRFTYVFTTGGIGPTHDDITADAVAAAFNASIDIRADAFELLRHHYAKTDMEFTDARKRMARIPEGASLIKNPVSTAPGFQIENVFVMAGVPMIVRAMLQDVGPRLQTGAVIHKREVPGPGLQEGEIAKRLGQVANDMPDLSFGSYPYYGEEGSGVNLVVRGTDLEAVIVAEKQLFQIIKHK